jgi:hypothetical protein
MLYPLFVYSEIAKERNLIPYPPSRLLSIYERRWMIVGVGLIFSQVGTPALRTNSQINSPPFAYHFPIYLEQMKLGETGKVQPECTIKSGLI